MQEASASLWYTYIYIYIYIYTYIYIYIHVYVYYSIYILLPTSPPAVWEMLQAQGPVPPGPGLRYSGQVVAHGPPPITDFGNMFVSNKMLFLTDSQKLA